MDDTDFYRLLFGKCKDSVASLVTLPDKNIKHYPAQDYERLREDAAKRGAVTNTYINIWPRRSDIPNSVRGDINDIRYATCLLGNECSLESISLQNDLNVLFDYFNCKDDSQKIEVINMMYAYNIIDRDDLCKDFFDSYEKEHGEEMSWSQKMDFQTQLKGNVAITLSKQFYTNLCTRINGKQVKMEDLFSIISVFETELSRQTWYTDPTKIENLYPFFKSYTEIQTKMFEMLAKSLNLTTQEVQKAYNAYNDNFNAQNLNVEWLLPNENSFFEYISDSRKADKSNSINCVYESLTVNAA